MVANSLLEIYTMLFGWNMYGAIWDILTGTGLALIPFIVIIVSSFQESYQSSSAEETVKGLEMRFVGMILVLMLCVIPYSGQSIQLSTIQYNLDLPDCNPPANTVGTGDNTGTLYDDSFNGMTGLTAYKPVAWYFVEFLSSAITHTSIKAMGCVNNYDYMLMRVGQVSIQDPDLRKRVMDFNEVCYKKARQRFEINPINIATASETQDIDWIGSDIFVNTMNEYYRHEEAFVQDMSMYGFTRQTTFRESDASTPSGAHPYCYEVWLGEDGPGIAGNGAPGLRQLLLDDIPADKAGDILDDWMDWGSEVMTIGTATNTEKENLILKMILQADAANLDSKTNVDVSNNFDTNSTLMGAIDTIFSGFGVFQSAEEFLQAQTMKQMLKVAGPLVLALIQMLVIMATPFVMLLGNYKLSSFVSVALTYFAFEFVNAIWGALFWFDNHVLDVYISEAGWWDIATNSLLIMTVSGLATILLPAIWLTMIAYTGSGMIRGMGMLGVGGGIAAGSGAFSSATQRTTKYLGNKFLGNKDKK